MKKEEHKIHSQWFINKYSAGFTLIELLIVIAIIGILSTLVLANVIGVRQRSRDAQRKADLRQLQSALELYRADVGSYPTSPIPACGSALTSGGATYMQKIPCDPMNTGQYVYTYTSAAGTSYTLIACLENINDPQKDSTNDSHCSGTNNWSITLTNP